MSFNISQFRHLLPGFEVNPVILAQWEVLALEAVAGCYIKWEQSPCLVTKARHEVVLTCIKPKLSLHLALAVITMAEALVFSLRPSNSIATLQVVTRTLPDCGPRQIELQFLAVHVNQFGFVMITEKYSVKLESVLQHEADETLAVPGSDGLARIIPTGSAVTKLGVGDIVVLRTHCRGTWSAHAVFEEDVLFGFHPPSTLTLREFSG